MVAPLMLSLVLAAPWARATPPATNPGSDPPVRLWLSSDGRYLPGDRARVDVQSAEDGYLLVLRAEEDGWVRVVYPVDPADDNFIRAGKRIEIRSRGDREAFAVSRRGGSGSVLAALSSRPFTFDRFVRGDHWDYRVFDSLRADSDPEATLLGIAQQMVGDGHFDYDATGYTVYDERGGYSPWH